ncbi:uncharacterized protein JCM10292_002068 [Rhodotorula paludigena]|uniref:uncharacterized protein n=1 Tax=Rhodotorula paludigena TaxID=86838 RepID=UPI00316CDC7C
MPYLGSTPSLVSSASPASLSALSLQCLTRSDDGFYRLPLTPSVNSAKQGARSREGTSDLSFPLPPLPDAAALLLDRAAAAQATGGGSLYGSSSGGATPSPTYSLPSSPPPSSAPPNLPDFVSVFVNPAPSGRSTDLVSRNTYPLVPLSPRPIPSHVRQLDSISSSVLSPPRASQHLRRRFLPLTDTHPLPDERHEPIERPDIDEGFETASIVAKKRRTEAWLSALPPASQPPDAPSERATIGAGSLRSGLGWLARARPGWAITSEGRDWSGEKLSDSGDSGHRGPARSVASRRGGWTKALPTSRKARITLAVTLVVVLLLAVGLATGLTRRSASHASSVNFKCENGGRARASSDGRCFCACPDAWGGTSCHLDATCIDVGGGADRPVAQGVLDVAASASELWKPGVNTTRLATVLHEYILPTSPSSTGTTCQSQLSLLALPSLSFSAFPSRLRWTESALLHTLALTESNSSLAQFRTFASSLSFSQFGDAPATFPSTNYQLVAGGYLFDLATLERSVRAEQTWEKVVDPPSEAVALIGPASLAALDRMSAQASAAHAQRSRALEHYWADTLALKEETLDAFRAAVKAAKVVVPVGEVDGVQRGVAIACRTGLSADEAERINEVEGGIFGLANIQARDATCTDRPIHGMLNLLNRPLLSSANSSSSLSVTSIVQNTISSRLTYHAGALLSPLSLAEAFPSSPSGPSAPATPERIGLAPKLDHVLLDYLFLLSSLDAARELVQYLTQEPAAIDPPDGRDFPVLAAVRDEEWPVLEVQLWGGWVAG